ncbi:MAG: hypothetical protein ACI8RZ_002089 [Myxococcota bacterium]|jgi:hypothetical protein
MLMLLQALCSTADAAPARPQPAEHRSAVLANPIGPVVAAVTTVTGTPTFDANLKGHHMVGDSLGWTLQADVLWIHVEDVDVMTTSLRGGPRISLGEQGLSGWYLTPFGTIGYTSLSASKQNLAHYAVVGGGLEAGRAWMWEHFIMELGLGLYSAFPVAYKSPAEALAEERPINLSPIKPSLTWSLGYAF